MNESYRTIPVTPMRKAIAARVAEAYRIPHFRVSTDVEVDAIQRLRKELQTCPPESRVSLTHFFIKACAAAVMDCPVVNSQWVDGEIRQYPNVDVAVVVALRNGLSTPIIRHAELKSVQEIAREWHTLADRAASNQLRQHEIEGGTITLSNLGMYEVDQFDAIINPPQCAILAVARSKPQVLPLSGGGSRVATVARFTLSADHRVIDGVTAAAFLSCLKRHLEPLPAVSS
jgi:pyruvate dehydrogenase E2 component (dihydrolipoamide acetyltransferase)